MIIGPGVNIQSGVNMVTPQDQYFANETLLLSYGPNVAPAGDAQSFTQDASTNNFAVTISGDAKNEAFNPFWPDGYWSNYFVASNDRLTLPAAIGNLGSSFCVECFYYPTVASGQIFVGTAGSGAFQLGWRSTTEFGVASTGVAWLLTSTPTVPTLNAWNHIVFIRTGTGANQSSLFINGTRVANGTVTDAWNTNLALSIGSAPDNSAGITGWVSNLRIVNGATLPYDPALTTLTQPTAPLTAITGTSLLTCQSNRFVDNSANASAITVSGTPDVTVTEPFGFRFGTVTATVPNSSATTSGYCSTYFSGTDYLISPDSPDWDFGTGDFTIELWLRYTTSATLQSWVSQYQNTTTGFSFRSSTANTQFAWGDTVIFDTSDAKQLNTWIHYAVSRQGTNLRVFKNGTQLGSTVTNSTNLSGSTSSLFIGTVNASVAWLFNGWISNVRIVKGVAVYTGNFTVPTAPLGLTQSAGTNISAIANGQTVFLLNGTTYGNNKNFIDSSTNNFVMTVNGNPSQNAITPFYGNNYSVFLNGTTDFFTAPGNAAYAFGTGDFTVEAWVYLTSTTGSRLMTNRTPGGSATGSWSLSLSHTTLAFTEVVAGEPGPTASFASILNKWTHVAACRSGTTTRLFVNGVQVGSATQTTNFSIVQTLYIGTSPTSESFIGGYVSNARILKGTALYTAAFTPPTAPLTAIANTSLLTCQSARFIDNSNYGATISVTGTPRTSQFLPFAAPTYNAALYGGSAFFNGSTDYLSWSGTSIGTNPYTIECWFNIANFTSLYVIVAPTAANGLGLRLNNSTTIAIDQEGSSQQAFTVPAMAANTWHHLAVVRNSSNVTTVFLNGVRSTTGAVTMTNNYSGLTLRVGYQTTNYFPGYISNLRMVVGSSVYDPTQPGIAVPTAPLTAVTNTRLLLNTNNVNTYDLTLSNPVANVNRASQDTRQPFTIPTTGITYPTVSTFGSAYFDGTGDQLSVPYNFILNPSSGINFTAECWVYCTARSSFHNVMGMNSATLNNWRIMDDSGTWSSTIGGTTVSGGTVVLGTWTHLALVQLANNMLFFVNGVQQGSTTAIGGWNTNNVPLTISGRDGGDRFFTGYISNARIVKGAAVYTANFTPPALPLTAIPATNILTLQQDGPANNNSFIDTGPNNLLVTRSGNTTQGSFTPYWPNGYWSNYFDGTGDYLTVSDNAAFEMTGDFTIEAWFNPTSNVASYQTIISKSASGIFAPYIFYYRGTTGNVEFSSSTNGSSYNLANYVSLGSVSLNTWNHIAVSRSGSAVRLFLNGALITTITNSSALTDNSNAVGIGGRSDGTELLTGYVSNVRIVKGTAVYTTAFTPPTAPLSAVANTSLLTCQSNRFRDNSVNNFTITINGNTSVQRFQPFSPPSAYTPAAYGGSMYFDGTGDYLTSVSSPAFAFGTGDFTIEFWTYPQANSRQDWIYFTGNAGLVIAYFSSGSSFGVFTNPPNSQIITGSSMPLNQWYHVALTRQSNNTRLFVNGVQQGSTYTTSQNYGTNNILNIGRDPNGATLMTGYLSDIRVLVGTALYTTTFTPPTSPLQVITNTAFLLPGNGATIYDRTGTNDLETQGNTQTVTSVRRLGAGCMYFDGTTDFLVAPSSASLSFLATGDFTIEFWAQSTQSVTGAPIVTCASGGGGATATNWGVFTNSAIPRFVVSDGAAYQLLINATSALSSSWSHIAITKSGTTYRLFFNGVLEGSATWAGTPMTTLRPIYVGSNSGTIYYSGYLDNLQITNGVARYTANFTPPVDNPIYR